MIGEPHHCGYHNSCDYEDQEVNLMPPGIREFLGGFPAINCRDFLLLLFD